MTNGTGFPSNGYDGASTRSEAASRTIGDTAAAILDDIGGRDLGQGDGHARVSAIDARQLTHGP